MGNQPFYSRYWSDAEHAIPTHDPLHPTRASHIVTLMRRVAEPRVVDAGAGAGLLTKLYANVAREVVALDVSPEAVAAAPALGPHVRFQRADLEGAWPVADGWADVVVSSEVIEHLFDFEGYLREASRVLKPGGSLYLTTPYHGRLKNLVLAVWGFERHYCNYESGHIRFFTNAHLARLAHQVGLGDVRFDSLGRLPALAMSTVLYATKR